MRFNHSVFILLAIAAAFFLGSACSVGMALSGKEEPNTGAIKIGQHRDEVLLHLGQPTKTIATEEGRKDLFLLERGNAPSTGRAIGHAAMDVLTLGVWEIIGTPVEGFTGEKFTVTIHFDQDDRVTKIETGPPKKDF